jgi:hypothetical protein
MLVLSPIDHTVPTNAMRRMHRRKSRVGQGVGPAANASVKLQAISCTQCDGGIQICRDPSDPTRPSWIQRC